MNDIKLWASWRWTSNKPQNTDGGSLTVALIAGGVALFTAGFAGSIAVSFNRVNRK